MRVQIEDAGEGLFEFDSRTAIALRIVAPGPIHIAPMPYDYALGEVEGAPISVAGHLISHLLVEIPGPDDSVVYGMDPTVIHGTQVFALREPVRLSQSEYSMDDMVIAPKVTVRLLGDGGDAGVDVVAR